MSSEMDDVRHDDLFFSQDILYGICHVASNRRDKQIQNGKNGDIFKTETCIIDEKSGIKVCVGKYGHVN